jgi:hypothetical protein
VHDSGGRRYARTPANKNRWIEAKDRLGGLLHEYRLAARNRVCAPHTRIAVGLAITDSGWSGKGETYKVFTFREPGSEALLLQDCVDRDDAVNDLTEG